MKHTKNISEDAIYRAKCQAICRDGAVQRFGDLSFLPLAGGSMLVIACDSSGGIGPKAADVVSVPGYIVGRFSARVPLMELLAAGARPQMIVNTLCVEPEPTGKEILEGIRDEARLAGLSPDVCITGSSEKNIPTSQTGVGITALGILGRRKAKHLGKPRSKPGNLLFAIGIPKVGDSVRLDDPGIADIPVLRRALEFDRANRVPLEIVPVGSRGIAAEARDLAQRNGLTCSLHPDPDYRELLNVSAGPSTCFVVSVEKSRADLFIEWMDSTGRPCWRIGTLVGS